MLTCKIKIAALLTLAMAFGVPAYSQDNDALISALIRKGVLTSSEAEEIRAEVAHEGRAATIDVSPRGKSTMRLGVGMRMQLQYAHLDTDVSGMDAGPEATSHAFLRRIYLTLDAGLMGNWNAVVTYDFASNGYDQATISWEPSPDLSFDFGLRKVNVAHEERASSGSLKAIERSGVTRYFVESNNGRRLGAASYRIGVFFDGRKAVTNGLTIVYGAAVTNPERSERFDMASSHGDGSSNKPALWANAGLTGTFAGGGSWATGVGAGYLPRQGGPAPRVHDRGFDLSIYSIHADVSAGRFGLTGEYLVAGIERGFSETRDATPTGFYIQPSLRLTDKIEAVVRFQRLDSDGHGVQMSDVIRSAPPGPVMNKFDGWYAGANWYLLGEDLKYQLGVAYGRTRDTVNGEPAEAKAVGVRSQMQVQF